MKKTYKFWGGVNFACATVLSWLFNMVLPVQVQAQADDSTGTGFQSQDGYVIQGEVEVKPAPATYVYNRQMPEADGEIYWHVRGAKTIDGLPVSMWPEGSLNANEHRQLKVEWDTKPSGDAYIQLRRRPKADDDGQAEPQVLAWLWVWIGVEVSCALTPTHLDRTGSGSASYSYLQRVLLCPGTNIPVEFTRSCSGNRNPMPYRWTFSYTTDQNHFYEEEWRSNQPNITLPLYERVPTIPFGTTRSASYPLTPLSSRSGNAASIPYSNMPAANPYDGERIVTMGARVIGYTCGVLGVCGTTSTQNLFVFQLETPRWVIAWAGTPGNSAQIQNNSPICRTGTYVLECAQPDLADTYIWTSSLGGLTGSGNRRTLTLTGASRTATGVTITVQARSTGGAACNNSGIQSVYFPFNTPPQVENFQLNGPQICAFPASRTFSVDPVPGVVRYIWYLLSPDARLIRPSDLTQTDYVETSTPSVGIRIYRSTTVVPEANAFTACAPVGIPVQETFVIPGPNTAAPAALDPDPQIAFNLNAGYWATGLTADVPVHNPQPGTNYDFTLLSVDLFDAIHPAPYYPNEPSSTTTTALGNYVTLAGNSRRDAFSVSLLTPRVAGIGVRMVATNACNSGLPATTQDFRITRPFRGSGFYRAGNPSPDSVAPPTLSPNPTADALVLTPPTGAVRYQWVRVLDMRGLVQREARAPAAAGITSLSLAGLPAGIYAVQLFDGERLTTQRVVKQ